MTLAAYETSRFSGEPVNLYLFTYGVEVPILLAYCDAEVPVTFDGVVYQPSPIDRGKIAASGTLDKANVPINIPQSSDIAKLYLTYPPSSVTSLVMRQGHIGDPDKDFKVVWTGRVVSCARKGAKAELTCEPVSTSMRRNGLRRRYQYGCPHTLYGPECRASKTAATRTTTVEVINGQRVTLPSGWPGQGTAAKFVQGLAEWTNADGNREVRTILRSEDGGLTFLLGGTTRGLVPGATIKIIYGCNHKSGTPTQPDGDCGPLHSNVQNFGGDEHIPFKNPVGNLTNQYY